MGNAPLTGAHSSALRHMPAKGPVKERMKDTSFSTRSSPRTRGPSLCPLSVRAIWQSLDSRVRGNERMWQYLHRLGNRKRPDGAFSTLSRIAQLLALAALLAAPAGAALAQQND